VVHASYQGVNLRKLFAVIIGLGLLLYPVSPVSAETTASRYIFLFLEDQDNLEDQKKSDRVFKECRDYYRDDKADEYSMLLLNVRESIQAPFEGMEIRVTFYQSCSSESWKYNRTVDLVGPTGAVIKLIRKPSLSRSTNLRDDPYWDYPAGCGIFVRSCWSSEDTYVIDYYHTAPAGQYSLKLKTTYVGDVCSWEGQSRICETDVTISKTFTIPKIVNVTQSGVKAAWEDKYAPIEAEPELEDKVVPKLVADQKTLASFSSTSTTLTTMQKSQVKAAVEANPNATKFICTGIRYVSQPMSENIKVRKRAKAACDYAKTLNPELSTWYQNKPTEARSYAGKVLLTIKSPAN
jgi:hypothetical protein